MNMKSFIDIPRPQVRKSEMGVNVLPNGKVTFNKTLMEQLGENATVSLKMTPDGVNLLILLAEDGYQIPKRGILSNVEFAKYLVEVGMHLPIHYTVKYDESLKGWLGVYDVATCIDNYVNRATKKRGGKRLQDKDTGAVL